LKNQNVRTYLETVAPTLKEDENIALSKLLSEKINK
jgi:hypothetical protein